MSSFLEYASKFEIVKNKAVEAFIEALKNQKKSFDSGTFTTRSWVKQDGDGYTVKLGKLETTYYLPENEQVSEFLNKTAIAARDDAEFKALIEAAYNSPAAEAKPRRGRKPKNA